MIEGLEPSRPIKPTDNLLEFYSGNEMLDNWLKTRAIDNEGKASRTYVVCKGLEIAGYYSLAVGGVAREDTHGAIRRNMPNPIPVMILARLAIAKIFQGQGLGRVLIKDAYIRTMQAATIAGIRAIVVDAVDENAARFYKKCGFLSSPISDLTLMLPL